MAEVDLIFGAAGETPGPTPTELEDIAIAKDAYAIFRGSLRSGEVKLFPHAWDGLPQHYRDLLCFVVAHARGGL